MNRLIETLFRNRGYTFDYINSINVSDHDDLKDIDVLASRLKEIHDNQLPVTIFPDFDMDGIASGSCFFAGLSELGFKVSLFIPDPKDGYGFSALSVDKILSMYPDTKVIITCDNGISSIDGAKRCIEKGVEFIVTDHHMQEDDICASIIVDPMRKDETYGHPQICGAYVVYQILQYYADHYCNYYMQDQIRRLRVFAGIGTVSDVMPLLYENRGIVRDCINIMRFLYGDGGYDAVSSIQGSDIYRRSFWGIQQAMKLCEFYGNIKTVNDINEDFLGFYFAPVFNSAKRMCGDMNKAFGVFFAGNPYNDMDYLYRLNVSRKDAVNKEFNAIMSRNQPFAPYIYFTDAPAGILGLLAMKLMGVTGMPTFVLNESVLNGIKVYNGSGRTPDFYPCHTRCNDLIYIRGHENAFGCSIEGEDKLKAFYDFLKADVSAALKEVEIVEAKPDFVINTDWSSGDTGIDIELFRDYLNEIELYRPFGSGFPAPNTQFVFDAGDVMDIKRIGKAKQHIKLMFGSGFDVLCWNQSSFLDTVKSPGRHVINGHLDYSDYQGEKVVIFTGNIKS